VNCLKIELYVAHFAYQVSFEAVHKKKNKNKNKNKKRFHLKHALCSQLNLSHGRLSSNMFDMCYKILFIVWASTFI